jgi:hypothetical protein
MRTLAIPVFLLLLLQPPRAGGQCGAKSLVLYLMGGFKGDRVKVVVDGKLLFTEVITTDESDGLAGNLSLKRVTRRQKMSLLVNGVLLNTTWLDPAQGCVYGYGFTKSGYFIGTTVFFKEPVFD